MGIGSATKQSTIASIDWTITVMLFSSVLSVLNYPGEMAVRRAGLPPPASSTSPGTKTLITATTLRVLPWPLAQPSPSPSPCRWCGCAATPRRTSTGATGTSAR